MKIIKYFPLFFGVFFLFFFSCESSTEGGHHSSGPSSPFGVPPRTFWAQNMETGRFYQVEAELLAQSRNCNIWVEKGSGVEIATADSVAKAYENDIFPKMMNTFAIKESIHYQGEVVARDTIQFADWLGDRDGKLCILLLDIKDDYRQGRNDSYVAGYFWPGNFIENVPYDSLYRYSNECDMIYIDTFPGKPGSTASNATLAHEMQHLMNFVTSAMGIVADSGPRENLMDTWIDEGLSSAAEWLYLGSHLENRWMWYNEDRSGLIQKGNNFFVWGNRENENQYAILDDYATVYLFFQWLRLQAGNSGIYHDIITSHEHNYRAITNVANKAMSGMGYDNWGALLKAWLAANYINAPNGPYGYQNDSTLKNIQGKTVPEGIKSLPLAPGEGVYSITNNFTMPGNTQYIHYAGLNKASPALSDTATYAGGALLTYNVNTDTLWQLVNGTTTGVASNFVTNIDTGSGRAAKETRVSGPFVIGAADMLRRKGLAGKPGFNLARFNRGINSFE